MNESEMGYRGSKSIAGFTLGTRQFKPVIVKEQRVDGSCIVTPSLAHTDKVCARPTLLGKK